MAENENIEVGLEIAATDSGIKATLRSRALAALDHLGADKLRSFGMKRSRKLTLHETLTETQARLISAAGNKLADNIENDSELAARTLIAFSRAEREAANTDACIELALEDLATRTDAAIEQDAGSVSLDMLNRWQRYAQDATEEEARERWGRVLAGEIRAPGTFSNRTMRTIDELAPDVGNLFERFCVSQLDFFVPKELANLSIAQEIMLSNACLISPPQDYGIKFKRRIDGSNDQILVISGGIIIVPAVYEPPGSSQRVHRTGTVKIAAYALTPEARSIAKLLPINGIEAVLRLALKLSTSYPDISVGRIIDGNTQAVQIENWRELAQAAENATR